MNELSYALPLMPSVCRVRPYYTSEQHPKRPDGEKCAKPTAISLPSGTDQNISSFVGGGSGKSWRENAHTHTTKCIMCWMKKCRPFHCTSWSLGFLWRNGKKGQSGRSTYHSVWFLFMCVFGSVELALFMHSVLKTAQSADGFNISPFLDFTPKVSL